MDRMLGSYTLIRNAFGKRSIEPSDLYRSNHIGTLHICDDVEDVVGAHFAFLSHRDEEKVRFAGLSIRKGTLKE